MRPERAKALHPVAKIGIQTPSRGHNQKMKIKTLTKYKHEHIKHNDYEEERDTLQHGGRLNDDRLLRR